MYDHPGIRINRAAMAIVNGITHINFEVDFVSY